MDIKKAAREATRELELSAAATAFREGWSDDLVDDEVIALQSEYFRATLPDPESVLWTIGNLHDAARAAYASGIRQRVAAGTHPPASRESAFGRI